MKKAFKIVWRIVKALATIQVLLYAFVGIVDEMYYDILRIRQGLNRKELCHEYFVMVKSKLRYIKRWFETSDK